MVVEEQNLENRRSVHDVKGESHFGNGYGVHTVAQDVGFRASLELCVQCGFTQSSIGATDQTNQPYAVVWIDPKYKSSTRVDEDGDTCPTWNETFLIPLPPYHNNDDYDKVYIDIVHAGREEKTKPLIGSAHLSLRDVIDDVSFDVPVVKTLNLKRPSGRPHGKLDVTVTVREPRYHPAPGYYHAPPYGYTHAPSQNYGGPYAPPPPQPVYGESYAPAAYGQSGYGYAPEKGSKFGGMGTGLAVGAVAGVLGGVALTEGVEALEEHIAEEAAEKVEDDLNAGEEDFDGGDDDGDS